MRSSLGTGAVPHWNLEYLCDAKRLNLQQGQWALFFTIFIFSLSYQTGDKSCRADGLSRLYQPDPEKNSLEPILPPAMIVSPGQWSIDEQINKANCYEPDLPGGDPLCTTNRSSVPLRLSGSKHTILHHCYWWPTMAQDIFRYIKGCFYQAFTTPQKLPEGKLVPLPIPHCPLSRL